ncbi:MAG: hypothetical protein QM831_38140 [Kofleriaceae bacterium]
MTRFMMLTCLLAGCLDETAVDDTSEADQALNGDTWETSLDEAGTVWNSVAVASSNHTVYVAGTHTDAGGIKTWELRAQGPRGEFGPVHALQLVKGASSEGFGITTDATYAYALGTAFDASGYKHWLVYRSPLTSASWTPIYDQIHTNNNDIPYGILITKLGRNPGYVYVAGRQYDGTSMVGVVLRSGAVQGNGTWTTVLTNDGGGPLHENAFTSVCEAEDGTRTDMSVFATGYNSYPGTGSGGTSMVAFYTEDAGATWTKQYDTNYEVETNSYQCTNGYQGELWVAAGAKASSTNTDWLGVLSLGHYPTGGEWLRGTSIVKGPNEAHAVAYVPGATNVSYLAGAYDVSQNGHTAWRTRKSSTNAQSFVDSDIYFYDSVQSPAEALAATYDSNRGLFVVGSARDGHNAVHGIVRHRSN